MNIYLQVDKCGACKHLYCGANVVQEIVWLNDYEAGIKYICHYCNNKRIANISVENGKMGMNGVELLLLISSFTERVCTAESLSNNG